VRKIGRATQDSQQDAQRQYSTTTTALTRLSHQNTKEQPRNGQKVLHKLTAVLRQDGKDAGIVKGRGQGQGQRGKQEIGGGTGENAGNAHAEQGQQADATAVPFAANFRG